MLLILIAAGVAFMHTLGHHPADATHHRVAVGHAITDAAEMTVATAVTGDDAPMSLDPMAVCLAILFGGLVLLVAALIMAWRRTAAGQTRARGVHTHHGPAPPRPTFGLRLADLSVLRT
jgi:acyl dehydratase